MAEGLYELYHYGVKRRSGRYPWGSGEEPYQHESWFLSQYSDLRKQGLSEKDIAKAMGFTKEDGTGNTSALRKAKSNARAEKRASDIAEAKRLAEKGWSHTAIGERMGVNESTVRSWLDPARQERASQVFTTRDEIKKSIDSTGGYLDIGAGSELYFGVSRTKLGNAVAQLEEDGYKIMYASVEQLGAPGNKTRVKLLVPEDTTYQELYENLDKIYVPSSVEGPDGKVSALGLEKPRSISSDRIQVCYAEDGGIDKDGVIELRPGVDELDMGGAHYAQVRIAVDDTHYLKGMAVYSDDLPKGVDIRFNTNKHSGTPKMEVFKELKDDPDNPFGATVHQRHYISSDGTEKLSALNIVTEEGKWDTWSKTLASQMLSKQDPTLAKRQLDLAESAKRAELDDILSLTNPTVKRHLLESFADDADAAAVHLQAAALPRQKWHVILPLTSLKDNEIYAPNYENGEEVVLVRYPHGGTFEMPRLKVNNKNTEGHAVLGDTPPDAVGINSKVAARLSGADFDGDTVLVIPTRGQKITTTSPLAGLKNFDPKEAYPYREGMRVISAKQKQIEMGKVSNLITDMTIKGASPEELARAVRHSMVVIDAEKHKLDFTQSYIDNGIGELKKKYQGSSTAGASTLISRAGSEVHISRRKDLGYDPVTGEKKYQVIPETYIDRKTGKTVERTYRSTKMAETRDAYSLSSGTVIEGHYAEYANHMKELARQARIFAGSISDISYSPQARKTYAAEVESLKYKLNDAKKNAPLERKAQVIGNMTVKAKREANPDLSGDELKRIRGQAIVAARDKVGASKHRIYIEDREWEAIQSGAVSKTRLEEILNNADQTRVRQLATPKATQGLSVAQIARAKGMAARGATQSEIASMLGVSASTVSKALRA